MLIEIIRINVSWEIRLRWKKRKNRFVQEPRNGNLQPGFWSGVGRNRKKKKVSYTMITVVGRLMEK